MLKYFTTWNIFLVSIPILREKQSRALLTQSLCVSLGGFAMILSIWKNLIYSQYWIWKEYKLNKYIYFLLEILIHQFPLIFLLKQEKTGNAWNSFIPVSIYCTIVSNPYKINGYKLSNYHGIIFIGMFAPLINYYTKSKNDLSI